MKEMFFLIGFMVFSDINSMEFNNKSNKQKICSLFSFGFCGLNSKDKPSQDDPQAEKIEYLEDIFGTPYNQTAIKFFTTSFCHYLEYFDNHYSLQDLLLFFEKANQKKWMPQFNQEKKILKNFKKFYHRAYFNR